jgi:cytochrome c
MHGLNTRFVTGTVLLALAFLPGSVTLAGEAPDQPWGYDTPAERCVVCHSLEQGGPFRVAPNLWGIVGAEKARDREWFSYSPALIRMGGTWTAEDLDAYLKDASAFMPGSTKSIRVPDPEERAEIIDFLRTLDD